jgi:hypothetical protein
MTKVHQVACCSYRSNAGQAGGRKQMIASISSRFRLVVVHAELRNRTQMIIQVELLSLFGFKSVVHVSESCERP